MKPLRGIAWIVGIALAFSPRPALAGTSSFSLSGSAIGAGSGAAQLGAGVELPASGAPRAMLTFFLPQNYVKNSVVSIVAQFHALVPNCSIVLIASGIAHRRAGFQSDFSVDVIVPKDGTNVLAVPSSVTITFQKKYALSPGGTMVTMKKGDQYFVELTRFPGHADDTCAGSVVLEAIDVRYTTP